MNSKKRFVVLFIIFNLFVLSFFSIDKTIAVVKLEQTSNSSSFISYEIKEFRDPIKQPIIDENSSAIYLDGITLELARNIEMYTSTNFDPINNPTTRIKDLSIIHRILAYIDLFYTLNDSWFLNTCKDALVPALNLEVNGTFILGENGIAPYDMYAEDNFLLVIMYERLAKAFEIVQDPINQTYWNNANDALSQLVYLFYVDTPGLINTTLTLDSGFEVIGSTDYTSSKSIGLFSIANYLAKDNSIFYNETQKAVDYFYSNARNIVTLSDLSLGSLMKNTLNSPTGTDTEATLQGNLFFTTALLQHSSYQKLGGNNSGNLDYFFKAEEIEYSIFDKFFSSTTGLLHRKYNFTTSQVSTNALSYENFLAISQSIEFFRKRYEEFLDPPFAFLYLNLFDTLTSSVFIHPDYFEAGVTTYGTLLFYSYSNLFSNPFIINFQAISTLSKIFPLTTILAVPNDIRLFEKTTLQWYIDMQETTSIFRSSNSIILRNFRIAISSLSNLNVTYAEYIDVRTTSLDGVRLSYLNPRTLNFTAQLGGERDIMLDLFYADSYNIFSFTYYFYIDKEIRMSTDPSNIDVIQGYDKKIAFTIKCDDEQGLPVKNAALAINGPFDTILGQSDTGGSFRVEIDLIGLFQNLPAPPDEDIPTLDFNITLTANKDGFLPATISKSVSITYNSLDLKISPSPPQVKEGSDLSLYINVEAQIPSSIFNPRVSLFLNEEIFKDSNNEERFSLPTTVIIESSLIKNDADLEIVIFTTDFYNIETGNFEHHFGFRIDVIPLKTLERIYSWIETALQSTWVQVLASLGVIWALLWRQIQLRIIRRLVRCKFCGEVTKRKYALCRNCGELINKERLPKEESPPPSEPKPESEQQPKYDYSSDQF